MAHRGDFERWAGKVTAEKGIIRVGGQPVTNKRKGTPKPPRPNLSKG